MVIRVSEVIKSDFIHNYPVTIITLIHFSDWYTHPDSKDNYISQVNCL
jgi:hypothetical protein